jgi:prepilin-type N-terminal cleavage/methylation domain-containing protein
MNEVGYMAFNRKGNGGFSLVEVLVALAILGIVITPVIGVFAAASRSNQKSLSNTRALTVARDIMDRIKAGDINKSNSSQEIASYKAQYGVEVYLPEIETCENNTLGMLNVYVAPQTGSDPQTEGIMLASYATNVFTDEIDTTHYGHGSGEDKQDPPGGEKGKEPDELWSAYYKYAETITTVAPYTKPTILVLPYILFDKVSEIVTMEQAVKASHTILLTARKIPPNNKLTWGYLVNEVESYYEFRLNPYDYKKYRPYGPPG